MCWSPDGKYLACGGEDDLVTVYSVKAKRVVARGQGHKSWINRIAFDQVIDNIFFLNHRLKTEIVSVQRELRLDPRRPRLLRLRRADRRRGRHHRHEHGALLRLLVSRGRQLAPAVVDAQVNLATETAVVTFIDGATDPQKLARAYRR